MCPHHSLASPMMGTLTSPPQTQRPDTTRSHSPHSSGMRCSGSDCRCAWSDRNHLCGPEQHRGPTRAPRFQDNHFQRRKTASPENPITVSLPFTHAVTVARTNYPSYDIPQHTSTRYSDTSDPIIDIHSNTRHTTPSRHATATNSHRTHHRNTNAHHQSTQVTHKPGVLSVSIASPDPCAHRTHKQTCKYT